MIMMQNCRRFPKLIGLVGQNIKQKSVCNINANVRYKSTQPKHKFNVVTPVTVSAIREIPLEIERPKYAQAKGLSILSMLFADSSELKEPEIKTAAQIQSMRDSCSLAKEILQSAAELVKPGITTDQIDEYVHNLCIEKNAYPSPLLYRGFPKSVCTSVNNVACHGIPDSRPLEEGDVINIDITVFYKGYHGDTSATFGVGQVDAGSQALMTTSKLALESAIELCGPDTPISYIGFATQKVAEDNGFSIVPHFCGHGIGSYFHGPPDIFHIGNDSKDMMKEGMTFTIEPILSEGGFEIKVLEDGWTAVTVDDSRTAQFEHTVLVTSNGIEVLT